MQDPKNLYLENINCIKEKHFYPYLLPLLKTQDMLECFIYIYWPVL